MRNVTINILVRYSVAGNKIDSPITLMSGGERKSNVKYVSPDEYETYDLGKKCSHLGETVCEVILKRKVGDKVEAFLNNVKSGKVNRIDTIGEIKYGFGPNGTTTTEPAETQLPKNYIDFYDGTQKSANDEARRLVGLLQWTHGHSGWINKLRLLDAVWSFDNEVWYPLPSEITFSLESPQKRGPGLDPLVVGNLYSADESLPIYREVLGEIDIDNMSRSSFVALLGALEIAIKTFIGRQVPAAAWLAMEAPTPPLKHILESYLHTIPNRTLLPNNNKLQFSTRIIKSVQKGVNIRNKITHQGALLPSFETVREVYDAVVDIVSTLEYCSGFEWSAEFISDLTRSELGFHMIERDPSVRILESNVFCTISGHVRRRIISDLIQTRLETKGSEADA